VPAIFAGAAGLPDPPEIQSRRISNGRNQRAAIKKALSGAGAKRAGEGEPHRAAARDPMGLVCPGRLKTTGTTWPIYKGCWPIIPPPTGGAIGVKQPRPRDLVKRSQAPERRSQAPELAKAGRHGAAERARPRR
jgi:hypothetical protein